MKTFQCASGDSKGVGDDIHSRTNADEDAACVYAVSTGFLIKNDKTTMTSLEHTTVKSHNDIITSSVHGSIISYL